MFSELGWSLHPPHPAFFISVYRRESLQVEKAPVGIETISEIHGLIDTIEVMLQFGHSQSKSNHTMFREKG